MMKRLEDLIRGADVSRIEGSTEGIVDSLCFDSRKAAPGALFFALRGETSDGHDYISQAAEAGVVAVVCEDLPEELAPGVTYLVVTDSHAALGSAASRFYGEPSRELKLIGVTGTNGKTTTATLLYDLHRKMGYESGLISTVVNRIGNAVIPATHTTPDAVTLNKLLADMVAAGCEFCFMEVSSHSVVQRRIEGLTFTGAIFTNITHDHLDYHGTFADYIKAKKRFFDDLPKGSFALVNEDDRNGRVMVQNTRADVYTYSLRRLSDFHGKILENHFEGTLLDFDGVQVWTRFIGRFNAYNLLSVYAASVLLGGDGQEVLCALSELHPVSGRFETVRSADGVTAIVDYAHTPDALQNVLDAINEIREDKRKLYTVVGCGGNRDRTKRPVMARIAQKESDVAILTSDNPRFEHPEAILDDMRAGLEPGGPQSLVITDRTEAIRTAVTLARENDIILIAGKGHETYQSVNGVNHPFDDREVVREAFEKRSTNR